jgi:RNA polymerase sigma-B factor
MTPGAGAERDEVARLFAAYRVTHDPAIRESLVLLHLGLVARLVRRFRLRGTEADDLRQVGCLGLIGAIDRYDPGRGVPFVGYAVPSVLGEIRRYFRDKASTVRMPRQADGGGGLQGDAPGVSGLASAQNAGDAEPGGGAEPWGSSGWGADGADPGALAEEETGYARSEDREVVRRVLHRLSPRERIVLYLRFHEGLSQAKVARRLGATQMRVCRWEHRALDKLRQAIGAIW